MDTEGRRGTDNGKRAPTWDDWIGALRQSGRRYRPGKAHDRPKQSERETPQAGGKRPGVRVPKQLELGMRGGHDGRFPFRGGQSADHRARVSALVGADRSRPRASITRSTRASP